MNISVSDFLALQNEVRTMQRTIKEMIDTELELIDIKSIAINLGQKPATIKAYIKRNSSSMGIGTIFRDDEFKVVDGSMMAYKSVFLKLKRKYNG